MEDQSFSSSKWCLVGSFHNLGSLCRCSAKIIHPFRPRCASYVHTLFPPDKDRCNPAGFASFTPWTGEHLPCLTWTYVIINEHHSKSYDTDWLKWYSSIFGEHTSPSTVVLLSFHASSLANRCCHVAGRHLTTHSGANRWSIPVANNNGPMCRWCKMSISNYPEMGPTNSLIKQQCTKCSIGKKGSLIHVGFLSSGNW